MATPRIVLLSVLDGQDRFGLGPETAAASAAGARVVPIATGIVESGDDGAIGVRPVRPRLVAAALREALEEPVQGMLIGLVPDYWQARAIHRLLLNNLPETLVWSPLSHAFELGRFLGSYNRKLQLAQILPEATVVALPVAGAGELVGAAPDDRAAIAAKIVERGAHAAWLRGRRSDGRGVDTLQVGSSTSTLDYPVNDEPRPPVAAAVLAALLADGRDLRESVEEASRRDARLGDVSNVAVRG